MDDILLHRCERSENHEIETILTGQQRLVSWLSECYNTFHRRRASRVLIIFTEMYSFIALMLCAI